MKNKGFWLLIIIWVLLTWNILFSWWLIIHWDIKLPWSINNFAESTKYLFSDHFWSINGTEVMSWNILRYLALIFDFFWLSTWVLIRFIFCSSTLISLLVSYYFWKWLIFEIRKTEINDLFLVLPSLIFTFNPWVLNQIQAWAFWIAYIIFLYLFKIIIQYTNRQDKKDVMKIIFCLFILSSSPQYFIFWWLYIIILLLIIWYTTWYWFINKKFFYHVLISLITLIILNASWIFVVYWIYSNWLQVWTWYWEWSTDITKEMILEFSRNTSIFNIIRWYDQWVNWYTNDIKYIYQVIISLTPIWILLFSIFFWVSKNIIRKYILFYIFPFIVFITLCIWPLIPWYLEVVTSPIMSKTIWFIFRTPQKLSFIVFITYTISILITLAFLRRKGKIILTIVLWIYFINVPLNRAIAYYTYYYIPIEQPTEYKELYNYLESISYDIIYPFKTVWLAPYIYWWNKNSLGWETSFTWNPWRNAQHTPETSFENTNISWYHLTFKSWWNVLYKNIYPINSLDPNVSIPKTIGEEFLSKANVKYLVYHNDIVWATEKWNEAIKILKESDLIYLKNIWDMIYVFENPFFKNILYTNTNEEIKFNKISPTTYTIDVQNNIIAKKIIFSQIYDPMWVLNINNNIIKAKKTIDWYIYFDIPEWGFTWVISYFPQKYYDIWSKISFLGLMLFLIYYIIILMYDAIFTKSRMTPLNNKNNTI